MIKPRVKAETHRRHGAVKSLWKSRRHATLESQNTFKTNMFQPGPLRGLCLWEGRGGEVKFFADLVIFPNSLSYALRITWIYLKIYWKSTWNCS
jgi:hypothetical protein